MGADDDGIDRRGFLGCMAWAGTAVVLTACGGEEQSRTVGQAPAARRPDFTFAQISDSHTVKQITATIKTDRTFHVPGGHDVFVDQGKQYRRFFGRGSHGSGYYSFDYKGVHFLALANVQASESETGGGMNGLGRLGHEQIAWVKHDLAHRSADTPVVVFGHVPLLRLGRMTCRPVSCRAAWASARCASPGGARRWR